ncbi:RNA 2',3'-cyclic phosphodiesterase [Methanocorpusculum sp. MG]|uniref:RNA 2',3'-cyclic phosphodiesterase n=1 Tax=Methanocorpusculum petauri TaxID=3002863 RepID=A0ABT4IF56_9EURY|nr:RNA 2',3'-cyclic phosphodiesterase [Methanocorpusculum petauri]MCZ0860369.1 RNA 2',3'-cyclic phosphodiesterase [Methanocorpusculum petauri]MDE2444007.1 RNA 2',3'-cyclic phosphodiesterase [Methanocorpusculum sp.]
MVRTFIAVEPSDEIKAALAAAGYSLQGTPARITAVQAPLMHITLRFLGEISESQISKITAALQGIRAPPYQITVSGVGVFGRPPRVIKADIADGGATADLARQIDALLLSLGISKDSKPFSPHLTIARVREFSPVLLPKITALKSQPPFGTCTIGEVVLKKSTLTPSGPIYETIAGVKL